MIFEIVVHALFAPKKFDRIQLEGHQNLKNSIYSNLMSFFFKNWNKIVIMVKWNSVELNENSPESKKSFFNISTIIKQQKKFKNKNFWYWIQVNFFFNLIIFILHSNEILLKEYEWTIHFLINEFLENVYSKAHCEFSSEWIFTQRFG